jgi:hypothetical protein
MRFGHRQPRRACRTLWSRTLFAVSLAWPCPRTDEEVSRPDAAFSMHGWWALSFRAFEMFRDSDGWSWVWVRDPGCKLIVRKSVGCLSGQRVMQSIWSSVPTVAGKVYGGTSWSHQLLCHVTTTAKTLRCSCLVALSALGSQNALLSWVATGAFIWQMPCNPFRITFVSSLHGVLVECIVCDHSQVLD